MGRIFRAWNGVGPTTASQVAVTTGTAIKTLLQLATPSTCPIKIKDWGITFDGSAAATPGICELLSCTGAATVTTHNAGDYTQISDPLGPASLLTLGTTAGGFTASGEGTPANVDMIDAVHVPPTGMYVFQWPLGDEPVIAVSRFVRVRVKFAAAINAIAWVTWEE